jgi:hypothetical protein
MRPKAAYLFAFGDIDLHELMNRFFKVELVVSNFSLISEGYLPSS